jgi:aspartate ammonia-lyase
MATRTETDALGAVTLPADALYGIQTARALANLAFSRHRLGDYRAYVRSLATVKRAAAEANQATGILAADVGAALVAACDAVQRGAHDAQFPVDLLGGGGSIGVNMNVNEVLANLANEALGAARGTYAPLRPADANRSQSTADVCHTAARLAVRDSARATLAAVEAAAATMASHAAALATVPTLARTCLQDAMPTTVDVLLGGHASALARRAAALRTALEPLDQVVLGATVIGTGAGATDAYRALVVERLAALVGRPLTRHAQPADALQHGDDLVAVSAALAQLAHALLKLAQDLRLLSSGPRGGFGELRLPHVQAGSSFFGDKSNPVIAESVIQCACQVIGADRAVQAAAERAELHLHVFDAVAVVNVLDALGMLAGAVERFDTRCLRGLAVDVARCREVAGEAKTKDQRSKTKDQS